MQASKFNIFFQHEEHTIGYNSFTNEFIILIPMLYEMYEACLKTIDFVQLRDIHPEFYTHLCNKGFLVSEEVDEIEKVKQLSYQIDNDESRFELHINPTMNCNFKCWYCYETHIKDSKMDEQTVVKTKMYINSILEKNEKLKEFSLSWFGGEPLLYFHKVMVPILKYTHTLAKSKGVSFRSGMTTNGLLITDSVMSECAKYDLDFFQITLDGNKERHDKVRFISEGRGSYEKIVSNIIELAVRHFTIVIRVNISTETLPGLKDIANDFIDVTADAKRFIKFDLHKVWQVDVDIDEEIQEMRWYYRDLGFTVVSGTHDTVRNSCYGDHRNHATLNYNGETFKCTARDFTSKNSEGKLSENGSIIWNEKYERRMSSKFKNQPCLECAILPICGGGCSQQAIEHEGIDYCVNDFDETKKLQLVKNKFFEVLSEIE